MTTLVDSKLSISGFLYNTAKKYPPPKRQIQGLRGHEISRGIGSLWVLRSSRQI